MKRVNVCVSDLLHNMVLLLQESLRVQEFFLQVDEEDAWIREREPQASSTDYGKDHSAVVALQQKHQALEAEIQGLTTCLNLACVEIYVCLHNVDYTHVYSSIHNVYRLTCPCLYSMITGFFRSPATL